jgi:hypothetical protein
MAKPMDTRASVTEMAQKQGVSVTPGQLEAAGQTPAPTTTVKVPTAPVLKAGEGKYFRVSITNTVVGAEPGAPNLVVRAADTANAWQTFRSQMGIISCDETVNKVQMIPAEETEFILTQAKRLRVDLREQRKTDVPKTDPNYGLLQWVPPGGLTGKYKVSDSGELTEMG